MLEQYDCDQIGIGLCPACLNKSRPFTAAQIGARFALVEQLDCVQELDMWVNDCPDSWLPYLQKFIQAPPNDCTCCDAVNSTCPCCGQSRA